MLLAAPTLSLYHVQVQTGASLQNSPAPSMADVAVPAQSPLPEQPQDGAQQVSPNYVHSRAHQAHFQATLEVCPLLFASWVTEAGKAPLLTSRTALSIERSEECTTRLRRMPVSRAVATGSLPLRIFRTMTGCEDAGNAGGAGGGGW